MKRIIAAILAMVVCLSLCACGATPTKAPVTQAPAEPAPVTQAPKESVPDVLVCAAVPADWGTVGCWAWKSGGEDAFEAWPGEPMFHSGNVQVPAGHKSITMGWYEINVPGWADRIIINGLDGQIQTADLEMKPGEQVWIHVMAPDHAVVEYSAIDSETMKEQRKAIAQAYHDGIQSVLNRGGYQISDRKFISYNQYTKQYCTDYIPAELLAENPEQIFYVVHLDIMDEVVGHYMGDGVLVGAIKPAVKLIIKELVTDKVVAESEVFMGGDPAQSIRDGDSVRGAEPDEQAIVQWLQTTAAQLTASAAGPLPAISVNEDALTEGEKAMHNAKKLAEQMHLSYTGLVRYLSETVSEPVTPEQAKQAADTCGANWQENALQEAKEMLSYNTYSYNELIDTLVRYRGFTKEEATYAANNCGANWGDLGLVAARELIAKQPDAVYGYYSYAMLVDCLMKEKGLSREEATYAADNCGLNWMEQARLEAQRQADTPYAIGYSEWGMRDLLADSLEDAGRGFTQEQAEYAMQHVKADWANEAVKRAKFYLEYVSSDYTKQEMIADLVEVAGFSKADATYGAEMNGLK